MRRPETIAKLREARHMIRAGYTASEIVKSLGVSTEDVAGQRRLMRLVKEPRRTSARDASSWGGGGGGLNKSSAESRGDLVDILRAAPSRADLRFGFRGGDQ